MGVGYIDYRALVIYLVLQGLTCRWTYQYLQVGLQIDNYSEMPVSRRQMKKAHVHKNERIGKEIIGARSFFGINFKTAFDEYFASLW